MNGFKATECKFFLCFTLNINVSIQSHSDGALIRMMLASHTQYLWQIFIFLVKFCKKKVDCFMTAINA